jgi:serine/threonine protein kinase
MRATEVETSMAALEDDYRVLHRLGEGSFGLVHKAVRISDGKVVAVKTILLDRLREYGADNLENELQIAQKLQHPNIAMLYAVHYSGESRMHLVMELCTAGDLLHLVERGTFFSEQRIARHAWEMVAGIAYCHHNRICHRDLKPENYLLYDSKGDAPLKLIDFGLARVFEPGDPMYSIVGTLQYCAPEMLGKGSYTEMCDIWSLGVVAFVLCTRRTPFDREEERAVIADVAAGRGDWHWLDCRLVGNHPLKRVIMSMLTLDPDARPVAKSFIEDDWFRERGTQRPRKCCPRVFG